LRILALETSGAALSAAAVDGPVVRSWYRETLGRGHAERVLPVLRVVMAEAGWAWPALDMLAVALGPGNFTGLRAGIAVARALSLALDRPALGIGTLEAVAQGVAAQAPLQGRAILVVMDARRDRIYAQGFAPDLTALAPPALVSHAEAAALADGLDGSCCLVVGDALPLLADLLNARHETFHGAGPDARDVAAAATWHLSHGRRPGPGAALRPIYVREPDARIGAGASLLVASG
jgi:tRNA threonylcarbamoyladenosine biosynthesis protein TsaB